MRLYLWIEKRLFNQDFKILTRFARIFKVIDLKVHDHTIRNGVLLKFTLSVNYYIYNACISRISKDINMKIGKPQFPVIIKKGHLVPKNNSWKLHLYHIIRENFNWGWLLPFQFNHKNLLHLLEKISALRAPFYFHLIDRLSHLSMTL